MTPEEADALAAIVEVVDSAGGRIRGTEVDHEAKGGVANAMQQMLGGEPSVRPVFTLEIVADPDVVLDEDAGRDADTESVTLDPEVAEVCLRELEILVSQTDHPTDEYGDAMTPLARARKQIENLDGEGIDDFTVQTVLQTLDGVASQTGAESSPIDPLQDDIFRAINTLEDELGVEESPEDDREQVEIDLEEATNDGGEQR